MLHRRDILDNEEAQRIITELYETGHGLADQVIEQILGSQLSKEEREDLIQEGFLRMIVHVEALKERSMGERISYMRSAMRNLAIDEGRRRTKDRLLGLLDILDNAECEEKASEEPSPEEYFILDEEIQTRSRYLQAALSMLEARDLALLTEKYGNRLSDREIGEKLGIRERNVASYLSRAKRRAARYYAEEVRKDQERAP